MYVCMKGLPKMFAANVLILLAEARPTAKMQIKL